MIILLMQTEHMLKLSEELCKDSVQTIIPKDLLNNNQNC